MTNPIHNGWKIAFGLSIVTGLIFSLFLSYFSLYVLPLVNSSSDRVTQKLLNGPVPDGFKGLGSVETSDGKPDLEEATSGKLEVQGQDFSLVGRYIDQKNKGRFFSLIEHDWPQDIAPYFLSEDPETYGYTVDPLYTDFLKFNAMVEEIPYQELERFSMDFGHKNYPAFWLDLPPSNHKHFGLVMTLLAYENGTRRVFYFADKIEPGETPEQHIDQAKRFIIPFLKEHHLEEGLLPAGSSI
jgi:hypothetical protein